MQVGRGDLRGHDNRVLVLHRKDQKLEMRQTATKSMRGA